MGQTAVARPKKKPSEPKVISVRCSAEWAAWVEKLAQDKRATVAGLIDRALTEWAASEGYKPVPPPR